MRLRVLSLQAAHRRVDLNPSCVCRGVRPRSRVAHVHGLDDRETSGRTSATPNVASDHNDYGASDPVDQVFASVSTRVASRPRLFVDARHPFRRIVAASDIGVECVLVHHAALAGGTVYPRRGVSDTSTPRVRPLSFDSMTSGRWDNTPEPVGSPLDVRIVPHGGGWANSVRRWG